MLQNQPPQSKYSHSTQAFIAMFWSFSVSNDLFHLQNDPEALHIGLLSLHQKAHPMPPHLLLQGKEEEDSE